MSQQAFERLERRRDDLYARVRAWVSDVCRGAMSAEAFASHMIGEQLDPRDAMDALRIKHPNEMQVLSQSLISVNAHVQELLTGQRVIHDHGVVVAYRRRSTPAA